MNWLSNCWYQAGWSDEVTAEQPLVRTILGTQILFLRGGDGAIAALRDRCPHRAAPLSYGTVADGIVRCGYHGLAFDGTGRCVDNPHGAISSALQVQRFPVEERHSAIWIWMGSALPDPAETIRDLSFIDETPESARVYGYLPTKANYKLLSDNILDLSHADYLHPTTLGGMMTAAKQRVTQDGDMVSIEWLAEGCDPPPTFRLRVPEPHKADIRIEVVWSAPAIMILHSGATLAGTPFEQEDFNSTVHSMTPETETTSHYFYCATRRRNIDDLALTETIRTMVRQAFEQEDKPILELQQINLGTVDLMDQPMALLRIDAGAVRARRVLDRLIAQEAAA